MTQTISDTLRQSAELKLLVAETCGPAIETLADWLTETLRAGNKALLFGNGGSSCDAEHIAAELVGRFQKERAAWPALSLTAPTPTVTSIANDYGYDFLFSRQMSAWARPGDLAIGLTTSGRSPNVLLGLRSAKKAGARCAVLTGQAGLAEPDAADLVIAIPSGITARVQECHITVGHILCDIAETRLAV